MCHLKRSIYGLRQAGMSCVYRTLTTEEEPAYLEVYGEDYYYHCGKKQQEIKSKLTDRFDNKDMGIFLE